ncbi:MAG: TRAP transporter large permease [Rhodospirillales bacterium]|nr:TRAP transporter large permease [Rhodospirillales bacterium]
MQMGVSFVLFLGLLASGFEVPFAIALPGAVYLVLQGGFAALAGLGMATWGSMDSFTLVAIPLFIFLAEVMQGSGVSRRIYRGLAKAVSALPGGLLQTNIIGCALFAAMTGSSVATAASIGGVALPQLIERGYERRMAAGSLAAGGTLGILFPPSVAMIIYSAFTELSVAKLFMAGVVPGLLLSAMFMLFIGVRSSFGRRIAPAEHGARSVAELLGGIGDLLPFLVLISGTMGSIYLGIATPVEAAAVGSVVAIFIAGIWGELSWSSLLSIIDRSIRISGNILFIIYAAYLYAYAIGLSGIGGSVTAWLVSLHLGQIGFFFALFCLYSVLGCFIESIGMIVITVPVLFPALAAYHIDPIWFGVILVMFVELGQISPPIGINLFVIQSVWDGRLVDVVRGTIPFHVIMFVLLTMLVLFPDLALWLPAHAGRL